MRSCTLSSIIHIFTKSRSLSFLPKGWIKWKKLLAVLLKASSSFLDKFLQAIRLNLIFTRVILLSALVFCSVPNKIFSITFLLSWIIKAFKPTRPLNCCFCLHLLYFWKLLQFGNYWFHSSFLVYELNKLSTSSFTFFCVSCTMKFAASDSRGFFRFLFLILDVPNS